jgi:hypothetical protein
LGGGDRDGVPLFAFGEDGEEKLDAAVVGFRAAGFVDADQGDAAVAGDGAGEL